LVGECANKKLIADFQQGIYNLEQNNNFLQHEIEYLKEKLSVLEYSIGSVNANTTVCSTDAYYLCPATTEPFTTENPLNENGGLE
jgi:hypothetical protein